MLADPDLVFATGVFAVDLVILLLVRTVGIVFGTEEGLPSPIFVMGTMGVSTIDCEAIDFVDILWLKHGTTLLGRIVVLLRRFADGAFSMADLFRFEVAEAL